MTPSEAYWIGILIGACVGIAGTLLMQRLIKYVENINADISSIDQSFGNESYWDSSAPSPLDRAPPKDSKVTTILKKPD